MVENHRKKYWLNDYILHSGHKIVDPGECEVFLWVDYMDFRRSGSIGKEAVSLSFGSVLLCLPDPYFWLWAKSLLVNPLWEPVHADISTYCSVPACEQGAATGCGTMDAELFSLLALGALQMHPSVWDHCSLLSRNLPCQFAGLLCFLQLCGANRACHPLRIKMYWPVWLSFSRHTWSAVGTPHTLLISDFTLLWMVFVEGEQFAVLWLVEYHAVMC